MRLCLLVLTLLCGTGCVSREAYVRVLPPGGGDCLSVGWITLAGPDGEDLRLVNTVHIGEKAFYSELQQALDGASLVLLEGVKGGSEALEDTMESFAELADVLGLVVQMKHIEARSDWLRPDVDASEIAGALRDTRITARLAVSMARTRVGRRAARIRLAEPDLDEEVVQARARAPVRRSIAKALAERDEDDPIIIVKRNERLLEELLRVMSERGATKGTVAVCYGVGHSMHLVGELERRGYSVRRVTWHRVFGL